MENDELYHSGKKGMRWGNRKASQYSTYLKTSSKASIDRFGGSKGKAATLEVGKGIGLSILGNVGANALGMITPPQLHSGIAAVNTMFQLGNIVNTTAKTVSIVKN